MFESKYENLLRKYTESEKRKFPPLKAGTLLVERMKEPERTTSSGIVLASGSAKFGSLNKNNISYVKVLAMHPLEATECASVQINGVVGTSSFAGVFFGYFPIEKYIPDTLGLITFDDILFKFGIIGDKSTDFFEKVKKYNA